MSNSIPRKKATKIILGRLSRLRGGTRTKCQPRKSKRTV